MENKGISLAPCFYLFLLMLIYCVPSKEEEAPESYCVVYTGYNQRWFLSVKELEDGGIEVINSDSLKIIIKNYTSYDCK